MFTYFSFYKLNWFVIFILWIVKAMKLVYYVPKPKKFYLRFGLAWFGSLKIGGKNACRRKCQCCSSSSRITCRIRIIWRWKSKDATFCCCFTHGLIVAGPSQMTVPLFPQRVLEYFRIYKSMFSFSLIHVIHFYQLSFVINLFSNLK